MTLILKFDTIVGGYHEWERIEGRMKAHMKLLQVHSFGVETRLKKYSYEQLLCERRENCRRVRFSSGQSSQKGQCVCVRERNSMTWLIQEDDRRRALGSHSYVIRLVGESILFIGPFPDYCLFCITLSFCSLIGTGVGERVERVGWKKSNMSIHMAAKTSQKTHATFDLKLWICQPRPYRADTLLSLSLPLYLTVSFSPSFVIELNSNRFLASDVCVRDYEKILRPRERSKWMSEWERIHFTILKLVKRSNCRFQG